MIANIFWTDMALEKEEYIWPRISCKTLGRLRAFSHYDTLTAINSYKSW